MRHKTVKIIKWKEKNIGVAVLLTFIFSLSTVSAQESIPTTGGEALGDGGSASYSIGQGVYTTNTGTNGYSVSEGVQQPYEISVVSGIEQAQNINLVCTAYPNPATNFLILKIKDKVQTQFIASLYDMNGKLLESKRLKGNETTISMETFIPATYFLKITDNQIEIKTFKIIKIQ